MYIPSEVYTLPTLKSFAVTCAAVVLAGITAAASVTTARRQDDGHKYSYMLLTKDGKTIENWHGPDRQFKKGDTDQLYVQKDGKTFLITDRSSISQMKAAMGPMMKIAHQQEELGDQQSRIGDEQAKIGEKQGQLGEQMGRLGGQLGELRATDDSESDAKAKAIQKKMEALQEQMHELEKQMDGPSQKQKALGQRQEELGRQEKKAEAEAEVKIDSIIDAAFAHGLAKPEK